MELSTIISIFPKIFINKDFIIIFAVIITSFLSSSLGVGSIMLLPLFSFYYNSKLAIAIMALYMFIQNCNKLYFFKDSVEWEIGIKIICCALPGIIMGGLLLNYIKLNIFNLLLGFFLIIIGIVNLVSIKFKLSRKSRLLPVLSFLYGLVSSLFGSGKMLKGPMLISMRLPREKYIATYAFTSSFMNLPKIIIYSFSGLITLDLIKEIWFLLPFPIIGTYIGRKFINCVPEKIFYMINNIIFIILGANLIINEIR